MASSETPNAVDFVLLRNAFIASLGIGGKRESSLKTAIETVNFVRKIIAQEKYENIDELLEVLREHLRCLRRAKPAELVIRNVFLIAMKLAREENSRAIFGVDKDLGNPYDSLNALWKKNESVDVRSAGKKMRKGLIAAVKEVITEMEVCREGVTGRIHDVAQLNDTLLTVALHSSPTLAAFLTNARRLVKMRQVLSVVDEDVSVPDYVNMIRPCDVTSVIHEVTKVVLPCTAVFPDGSCLAPAGTLSICYAAHRHSIPVFVLAAFYKMCPYFVPSAEAASFSQGPVGLPLDLASRLSSRVILSPVFDVIPSHLVSLYISNNGAIVPSHVYRLITDYYHPEDSTDN